MCLLVAGQIQFLFLATHFVKQKRIISFSLLQNTKFCRKFSEKANLESRPHSSPDLSCGREISRGKTKNHFPQKNRFSFCRVRIEAPRTAQKLLGQNPERKTPFPFSKEISPSPNQESKRHFSLGLLAYSPVRGACSESFILKVGSSLVQ